MYSSHCLLFSEGETVPGGIVIEDVEESVSEKGADSDFLPNTVREVISIPCATVSFLIQNSIHSSHKQTQSKVIFLLRLGCGLDYVHSRAGSSNFEHSLTFPGNVCSSAYILYVCG